MKEPRGTHLEHTVDAIMDIVGQLVRSVGVTRHRLRHTAKVEFIFHAPMMYHAILLCSALGHVQFKNMFR